MVDNQLVALFVFTPPPPPSIKLLKPGNECLCLYKHFQTSLMGLEKSVRLENADFPTTVMVLHTLPEVPAGPGFWSGDLRSRVTWPGSHGSRSLAEAMWSLPPTESWSLAFYGCVSVRSAGFYRGPDGLWFWTGNGFCRTRTVPCRWGRRYPDVCTRHCSNRGPSRYLRGHTWV